MQSVSPEALYRQLKLDLEIAAEISAASSELGAPVQERISSASGKD